MAGLSAVRSMKEGIGSEWDGSVGDRVSEVDKVSVSDLFFESVRGVLADSVLYPIGKFDNG